MYEDDPLTHKIIGCGIEAHRVLGPGLFEGTYEEALCLELTEAGIPATSDKSECRCSIRVT